MHTFDTVSKITSDWCDLKRVVDLISNHVFYNVLEIRGHVCGDFRFEFINGEAVVVQQFQDGSYYQPFPNATFSYPLAWLNLEGDDLNHLSREQVIVNSPNLS